MRLIARLLRLASPLSSGFSISIANSPWHDLVISDMQTQGPHRLPTISVAHCHEHQGHLVRAPEMLFEVETLSKRIILRPYCLGNESPSSQRSVCLEEGRIRVNHKLQAEHITFASTWNKCLEQQGFLAAFQRGRFVSHLWQAFDIQLSAENGCGSAHLKGIFDQAVSTAIACSGTWWSD